MKFRSPSQFLSDRRQKKIDKGWVKKFAFFPKSLTHKDYNNKEVWIWFGFYEARKVGFRYHNIWGDYVKGIRTESREVGSSFLQK